MTDENIKSTDLSVEEILATLAVFLLAGSLILFNLRGCDGLTRPEAAITSPDTPAAAPIPVVAQSVLPERTPASATETLATATTAPDCAAPTSTRHVTTGKPAPADGCAVDALTADKASRDAAPRPDTVDLVAAAHTPVGNAATASPEPPVAAPASAPAPSPPPSPETEVAEPRPRLIPHQLLASVGRDPERDVIEINGVAPSGTAQVQIQLNGGKLDPIPVSADGHWSHQLKAGASDHYALITRLGADAQPIEVAEDLRLGYILKPSTAGADTIVEVIAGYRHQVAAGDTPEELVDQDALRGELLHRFNGLKKGELKPGTTLFVPITHPIR
ncbi:MAG: hypothetical protein ACFCUJ_11565 [Thiotrichales bacterium]